MRRLVLGIPVLAFVAAAALFGLSPGGSGGSLSAAEVAIATRDDVGVVPRLALVTGYYGCSAEGEEFVRQQIEFMATGIPGGTPGVFMLSSVTDGQSCADFARTLSALASTFGCKSKTTDFSGRIDLRLICEAESSSLIHAMGEMGRLVITR